MAGPLWAGERPSLEYVCHELDTRFEVGGGRCGAAVADLASFATLSCRAMLNAPLCASSPAEPRTFRTTL